MKNRIRQLREEKGLTQEQLGEMVGTSRQAINAIETEKSEPSIWLAHDISQVFGCKMCIRDSSKDVIGYLNNWADVIVVRHKDIAMLETMSQYSKVPVINALTAINHPCEMLADMYALSKIRKDFTKDKYLFCGLKGNIGLSWKEAADVMGFELSQCLSLIHI